MVIAIDQAKREQAATAVTAPAVPDVRSFASPRTAPGVNPQDWIAANRIHVKDGSLFIDPYLVIHPRELAPENEAQLRKKLQLTYSINNPSFFESSTRTSIALNLGQLVPISTAAKRSKLMDDIAQFNAQAESGVDPELKKQLDDKHAPFAAIARGVMQHPAGDPVGVEMLKNSLAVYLLLREKLTQNGYLGKLTEYVQRVGSPDQVLADLAQHTGVSPLAVREAAFKGGIDGIGQLLKLDPKYISDVKQLVEYAATQDFSYNLVEHWHLGRQLQGLNAPLQQKITTGLDARITAKIAEYRDRVRGRFDVPAPVATEEKRIADMLNLVEPVQRELMFRQGYEICFSPDITADDIAFYPGIYGLHRKAANDLRDVRGTYRIYFSGRGDLLNSACTAVHEINHNLWPETFSAEQINHIDQLAQSDQMRFMRFNSMMTLNYREFEQFFNAYKAGNEQEKAAVIEAANSYFAASDFHAEGLFPYLRDAHDFRFAVKHAYDTLQIEGERYNRSGYHSPEERFREVISRFSELSQVRYRGEPEFLQFLAPGLNQIYNAHYLPHLARVNEALKSGALTLQGPLTQKDAPELSPTLAVAADGTRIETGPQADAAQPHPQPKVEERPGTPLPPTATPSPFAPTQQAAPYPVDNPAPQATSDAHALTRDSAPLTHVAAASIQLNPTTLAAFSTLQSMGIVQH